MTREVRFVGENGIEALKGETFPAPTNVAIAWPLAVWAWRTIRMTWRMPRLPTVIVYVVRVQNELAVSVDFGPRSLGEAKSRLRQT